MMNWVRPIAMALISAFAIPTTSCGSVTEEISPGSGLHRSHSEDRALIRTGQILIHRDGKLHLIQGQGEHQVNNSGYSWAGAFAGPGTIIAALLGDDGRSSVVKLRVDNGLVTREAETTLSWQPSDRIPRPGHIAVSPSGEHALIGNTVIALDSWLQTELLPNGCCPAWSSDGSLVAYLVPAEDQKDGATLDFSWDLWVMDVQTGDASRRRATGLMQWDDPFGRDGGSLAWLGSEGPLLVLTLDGARVIDIHVPDAYLRALVNNQLASVDLKTGSIVTMASPREFRSKMTQLAGDLQEGIASSAAATPTEPRRAAFLTMDYGGTYGIGVLDAHGQLVQFVTEVVPNGQHVRMGAPRWSPDGTRFAFFGWQWRPRWIAFIEVFDVATGRIDRIWESDVYVKPGHWDWSPDGEWIWIVVETSHVDDPRRTRDLSLVVSAMEPGYVEPVPGIIVDWCCVQR